MNAEEIAGLLERHNFHFGNERDLQDGIELTLRRNRIEFEREFIVDKRSRIDFKIGDVGLEVKIKGSLSDMTRQLYRYAQVEAFSELILVTSRHFHDQLPAEMNSKPIRTVRLAMAAF